MRRLLICAVVVLVVVGAYAVADAEDLVPGVLTLTSPASATSTPTTSIPTASASSASTPPASSATDPTALTAPSAAAPIPSPAVLRARLTALVRHFGQAGTAEVVDVATGRPLYARGATRAGAPASTAKLLTAVSVLSGLGPQAKLTTSVVRGPGHQIVLVGGGDTQLATGSGSPTAVYGRAGLATLAASTATAVRAAGLSAVTLGFDDSLFSGPKLSSAWAPSDAPTGEVGPITALGLAADAPSPGHPAPADPSLNATTVFAKLLRQAGIAVHGAPHRVRAAASAARLAAVQSASIGELVATTLTISDNTEAEVLARLGAHAAGLPASFAGAATENVRRVVALGIPVGGIRLYDGSGLARRDRIAARTLTGLLTAAATSPEPALRALFAGLPVAGLSGTLAERYRSGATYAAAGIVRAKTGTLSGVNTLAGVTVDADGRLLAFAFMADHVVTSGAAARLALDRAATALTACGCR